MGPIRLPIFFFYLRVPEIYLTYLKSESGTQNLAFGIPCKCCFSIGTLYKSVLYMGGNRKTQQYSIPARK